MRLLNAQTKQFEEFFDRIPRFAILSHTWGENELTFKQMEQNGYVSSKKIDGCCEQAKKDGLEYVWVDTCCIDKSSSAELSEAINSMWEWYWFSQVCYAYLSDVTARSESLENESEFEKSRWFTRGWTLQELIAPKKVNFYDEGWNFIGCKGYDSGNFVELLSKVTKINSGLLRDRDTKLLSSFSIAQRMSWASHRATTRLEDRAYSLLGLFEINMPLLYGEGDRAFRRLQEEIIKVSDDESIFAWGLGKKSIWEEGGSLFARAPRDFENCSRMICSTPKDFRPSHYTLTNKGLQIETSILALPIEGGIVLARLNCTDFGKHKKSLALVLVRSRENDMVFTRYSGTPPVFISRGLFPDKKTQIYVHRSIGHSPLQKAFYSGLSLHSKYTREVVEITEAYPPVWFDGPLMHNFRGFKERSPQHQDILFLIKSQAGTGASVVVWLNYEFAVSTGYRGVELSPRSLEMRAAFLEERKTLAEVIVESKSGICWALDWHETLDLGDSNLTFEVVKQEAYDPHMRWRLRISVEKKETPGGRDV